MSLKKIFTVLVILTSSLLSFADDGAILATIPTLTNYNFPYSNPEIASLTTVIMQSTFDSDHKVAHRMDVTNIPGRDNTFLFEGRGQFRFNFFAQNKAAPLVFIIADLGGSFVSGYMIYEAELLYKSGYNVIAISSPFFWNFVISSGTTALPGVTDEDAQDLYSAMHLALNEVKQHHNHTITKIGAMGLGLGALELAHLSVIDQKEKKLNIERYVFINPIVNLVHSVTQIEKHVAIALDIGMNRVDQLKAKAFNFVFDNMDKNTNDPGYFLNLQKKFPLKENEYQFLFGANLRMTLGDTIFASQMVKDLGVLKSSISEHNWDARHTEVNNFNFLDYFQKFLLPNFKKYNFFTIQKHVNLDSVEPSIKENPNMFLMHNLDDPLVSANQVTTLVGVFGPERSKIYPRGGHLGNLWFSQNQKDLLQILSVLK